MKINLELFGFISILLQFCNCLTSECSGEFQCFRDNDNYLDCNTTCDDKSRIIDHTLYKYILKFNKSEPFESIRQGAIGRLCKTEIIDISDLNFITINKDSLNSSIRVREFEINDNITHLDRTAFLDWSSKSSNSYLSIKSKIKNLTMKELIFNSTNWKVTMHTNKYSLSCYKGAFINNEFHKNLYTVEFGKGSKSNIYIKSTDCIDLINCSSSILTKVHITPNSKSTLLKCANNSNPHLIINSFDKLKLAKLNGSREIICCRYFINNVYKANVYTIQFIKSTQTVNNTWINERNCSDELVKCGTKWPTKICFEKAVPKQIKEGNVTIIATYTRNIGAIELNCNGHGLDRDTKFVIDLAEWNLTFSNCTNRIKCFRGAIINQTFKQFMHTVVFGDPSEAGGRRFNNTGCTELIEIDLTQILIVFYVNISIVIIGFTGAVIGAFCW